MMSEKKKQKLTLSIAIRSLLFNFCFYSIITIAIIFVLAPLSFRTSAQPMRNAILKTIDLIIWLYDKIANVKIEERGIENIPQDRGLIFCSKHMSNMDALVLYRRSPNLTALAKKELFRVPLLSFIFKKMRVMAINRGAGEAQKQTPKIASELETRRVPMIIFAEGTRTIVGERRPLKSGVYFYQKEADLDVVVVSHNSGVAWPKKSWIRWPGTTTFEYHQVMPKGMDKNAFMAKIEKQLIDGSEDLIKL